MRKTKILLLFGLSFLILLLTASSCGSTPEIGSFTANPATITAGETSTLSWNVRNATSLSINQGVGDVTGQTSVTVSPTATTTYTLTATNSNGSVTRTVTVTVEEDTQTPGSLEVSIDGLPAGVEADVNVSGPNNFSEELTSSRTLSNLSPGDYTITAVDVTHQNDIFSATVSSETVSLSAGGTTTVSVAYDFEVIAPEDTGTHDDQLGLVAELLPDFGGMFFDEEGVLNVFLLEPSPNRQAEALRAIIAVFGDEVLDRGRPIDARPTDDIIITSPLQPQQTLPAIKLIQGEFAIPEMLRWNNDLDRVLGVPGVVFTDLDEARNRLAVGVEDTTAMQRVEAALAELGIPRAMVIIEEEEPFVFLSHTLRSSFRPVIGGVQIQNSGGGICTVGFNTVRSGVNGFVTNSHCTNIQGGVEATTFGQQTFSGANLIGIETADPRYKRGSFPFGSTVHGYWCPPLRDCRISDSAFITRSAGVTSNLGRIARPSSWNTGALTINHTIPTLPIVAKITYPIVGEELDKVGRTTGWSYGNVTKTCQRVNVKDTNFTLLCQDRVKASSTPGDSGSPVFKWIGNGNVRIYGILWGGNGSEFVFSAIWNLQKDLGTLITH